MTQLKALHQKVAIVTGAGRGIGRAIATAYAHEGAKVVLAARTLSEIEETTKSLVAEGYSAVAIEVDVSEWESVQALVERTIHDFNGAHILVNNAGIQGAIGPLVKNDPLVWAQTIQVNLVGTFYCCKATLPMMIQQRFGKIINLSGGGATAARPNFSAYAASKTAIVRLTETLAEEVKEFNVQVNAMAPGAVNTRMLAEILEAGSAAGEKAMAEAERQLETGGTPPELAANLAVFLASEASGSLTGKLIAAPYDPWREWAGKGDELNATPMYTIRRLDPFTIKPLVKELT
jgi:3-oxoacyl-[acyl-carrier protein] reductase